MVKVCTGVVSIRMIPYFCAVLQYARMPGTAMAPQLKEGFSWSRDPPGWRLDWCRGRRSWWPAHPPPFGAVHRRALERVTPSVSTSDCRSAHFGQLLGGAVLGRVVRDLVDPAAPDHPDPCWCQDPVRRGVVL